MKYKSIQAIIATIIFISAIANGKNNNTYTYPIALDNSVAAGSNYTETAIANSQPRKPGNKGIRRLRNRIFTVNLFKHNKRIREKRDKQLKASKHNRSPKAHRNNNKTKHILLRGSEGKGGFNNKRKW